MKKLQLLLAGILIAGTASAEVLSITSGIDLDDPTQLSVDAGYSSGDIDTLGARVNYRLNPDFLVFAGIGHSDLDSESDLSFGGGVIYTLPDFGLPFKSGIKASFYRWSATYDIVDVDIDEITVRYVMSGNIDAVDNLKWFGEAGLHFLSSSVSYNIPVGPEMRRASSSWDDTELGLEVGLLYDITQDLTGIVSLEIVDSTFVNLAVRYKF